MACPSCGGTERTAIAPGYFECTTPGITTWVDMVPDGRGGARPLEQSSTQPCGERYQEGVPPMAHGDTCECGTFAIGNCQECGTPVCGDHSGLFGGRRLCARDNERLRAARAEEIRRQQIDVPTFLKLAAEAGNPGLRTWTLVKVTVHAPNKRRGLLGKRTVYQEPTRSERKLHAWLFPYGYGEGALVLDVEGGIHRATWDQNTHPRGTVDYTNWSKSDVVPEDQVMWDWANEGPGRMNSGTPELIDQALRMLAADIGLDL